MLKRFVAAGLTFVWLFISANGAVTHAMPLPQNKPKLEKNSVTEGERTARLQKMLAAAVRHELLTLPYYDIFDWLEAELLSDGTVVLRGEVVRPTTSDDAETRIRRLESVTRVVMKSKCFPSLRETTSFALPCIAQSITGTRRSSGTRHARCPQFTSSLRTAARP